MSDLYRVPPAWAARANVGPDDYAGLYERSLNDADAFWLEQAGRLDWIRVPT